MCLRAVRNQPKQGSKCDAQGPRSKLASCGACFLSSDVLRILLLSGPSKELEGALETSPGSTLRGGRKRLARLTSCARINSSFCHAHGNLRAPLGRGVADSRTVARPEAVSTEEERLLGAADTICFHPGNEHPSGSIHPAFWRKRK